jgi:uncharacterized protein (TIGR02001 family)
MRKTILAASLATATLALPGLAFAQAAPAAAPASPHTVTGNLGLFSSYRFRGIDQTFGQPAIQGGIDYSHSSGWYAGNWDSNINQGAGYPGGNIEMDFYGGWKKSWGDWGLDLGGIYYYYPGTNSNPANFFAVGNNKTGAILNGRVDNGELYIAGSWKWISLKYSHAVTNYFGTPSTSGSSYIDLSGNYDLGNGWGVNGHVGTLNFKNVTNGDYTDWKIGVTKDIGGWVFAASYIGTNAKGDCGNTTTLQPYCLSNGNLDFAASTAPFQKLKDLGRSTAVVSVSKTF